LITLMISFGAGVAPSDCATSCNSADLVGRWLAGVSLAMAVSLAVDLWLPGWKARAARIAVRRWRSWSRARDRFAYRAARRQGGRPTARPLPNRESVAGSRL
jgi:hypothetical protein